MDARYRDGPFDLQALILLLRPDLRELFDTAKAQGREDYLSWLLIMGRREYRAVSEVLWPLEPRVGGYGPQGCLSLLQYRVYRARRDLQQAFALPAQLPHFLEWFYTHGVEELDLWPRLSEAEKRVVLALPEPWRSRLRSVCTDVPEARPGRSLPLDSRQFGVNLVGYAFGQLGIGEDARMAARSLLAAKVPLAMLDFPPGANIPQNDRSMEAYVSEQGEFAFNIFCMTAEENGRFYAERGSGQFRNRYNIGYWPWELGRWPKEWEMMLALVDEVWVSTRHTYDALKPVCNKPLQLMPMAVDLGPVKAFRTRAAARRHFGLPEKARLFCFAFDLHSWVQRKNPQGCIDAFLKAFPKTRFGPDEVGLVIKTGKPHAGNPNWERLKKLAAGDPRIHIIEATLPRPELLALYKACDCFLSLHRAEGFGRGLAEALQLGLHVICTGYSGNVDFCRPPHADLVKYSLVKVGRNEYVYPARQVWAEPDIGHAAKLMRAFVEKPPRVRKSDWPEFSPAMVGKRYKARLEEIWRELRPTGAKAAPARKRARAKVLEG